MSTGVRVLVVDDDPDVRFATARVARVAGHDVMEAPTGAAAREMATKDKPDLILLDVVLPDADGAKLCEEFKNDPALKGMYIVLMSGRRTSSDEQAEGLDVGADGYIARPVSNRELRARLAAMVRILIAERERDRLIDELKDALSQVKRLSGLLPVCAHCKQVRDDKGYWTQIETYVQEHSEADFSHGICPACAATYYSDLDD